MTSMMAALALAPAASATPCPDSGQPALTMTLPRIETSTLCVLNRRRADHHLAPLHSNSKLAAAASSHSSEMRSDTYFAHDSANGSSFSTRIVAAGYLRGASSWLLGENLAWGDWALGTRSLVKAWINSPEHRANVFEPRFREIGIGADWGSPNDPRGGAAIFLAADFGQRTP